MPLSAEEVRTRGHGVLSLITAIADEYMLWYVAIPYLVEHIVSKHCLESLVLHAMGQL